MAKNSLSSYLHIGENMKRERKAAGYTQREFAQLLGIPVSTYSNYENGNRDPGYPVLKSAAEKLGIPVDRLFSVSSQVADLAKKENRGMLEKVAEMMDVQPEFILDIIANKEHYDLLPKLDALSKSLEPSLSLAIAADASNCSPEEYEKMVNLCWPFFWHIVLEGIDKDKDKKLLGLLKSLNSEGQEKAMTYLQDLSKIPQYQKTEEEKEGLWINRVKKFINTQMPPNDTPPTDQPQTAPEKDSGKG